MARQEATRDRGLAVVARPDHQQVIGSHAPLGTQDAVQPLVRLLRAAVADPEIAIDAADPLGVVQPEQTPGRLVQMRGGIRVAHSEALDVGERNNGAAGPGGIRLGRLHGSVR